MINAVENALELFLSDLMRFKPGRFVEAKIGILAHDGSQLGNALQRMWIAEHRHTNLPDEQVPQRHDLAAQFRDLVHVLPCRAGVDSRTVTEAGAGATLPGGGAR